MRRASRKEAPANHKRALPTRHNFLTDAVRIVLERLAAEPAEQGLNTSTILHITDNEKELVKCENHHDTMNEPDSAPVLPVMPSFKLAPNYRLLCNKPSTMEALPEPLPEDFYIRRHRKHELEEKKQKNREKERLQHEFYQQQQMVQRIKTLDKGTLKSIVSSLRHRMEDVAQTGANLEAIDLDVVHEQLLKDAEDYLHRFEMLGLNRARPPVPPSIHPSSETHQKFSPSTSSPLPSGTDTTKSKSAPAPAEPPTATPKRRGGRSSVAFGKTVPSMKPSEFLLPDKPFAAMMDERAAQRPPANKKRKLSASRKRAVS
ncbi:uncharacterized protein BYT42DRAFT_611006 [Radiomyces spectabilis]|uniref:uncharacterized protein n=1 Tax=Radiomyces spectabilis TaxID=64574 RepID=UPI00222020B6|nr:uncharacterized protein BYT42DRAFT_611006 [Radiomyces spectabilis]KAI8391822.1 hypothetical protein BYT42DRAFT_611006 [Radiomyces spectabilis]